MPKILVVDDSLSVRKVVQRALEARKVEVLSAASASEPFERIERAEPDLVVCAAGEGFIAFELGRVVQAEFGGFASGDMERVEIAPAPREAA